VGIGIDLVEHSRVATSLERWGDRLVGKLMGPDEAAHLPKGSAARAQAVTAAIALKEAASPIWVCVIGRPSFSVDLF